jgi:spore coat protein CotH
MNHFRLFFFLLIALNFIFSPVFSQADFPEAGSVYRDNMVPRVDISINPDTLAWIYENVESNLEFRATFTFTTDTLAETVEEVGFRLRGNTSRESQKKSFKVSFNTYQSGRKFYGVEKLNLNGEHNDPSVIRAKIGWDLLREFGIPAPRANHVRVYINGNYYGLYINVEHIDEEFVESRFENKDGNLYKCLWPADLTYQGTNPENYKYMAGDRRVYDLKSNTEADDYTDLANFISKLNQLPSSVFACEMKKIFNVYDYLRVIAMDIFLGNWDGPIYNKNNFYLYSNTASNKIEYIPYDLDNTLGIDWFDRDWSTRNIYDWQNHSEERPIYTKMMANVEFREVYSQYLSELLNNHINEAFIQRILDIKEMIAPYLINDPYYPLDYGYTMTDFHNSYTQALGNHVKFGLIPYIEARKASALEQLEAFDNQAVINHIRHKFKTGDQSLRIRAYVREAADSVVLRYSVNDGAAQELLMFDDGLHFDINPGDGVYATTLSPIPLNTQIEYQIKSYSATMGTSLQPCIPVVFVFESSLFPMLKINEFMATNDTTITDEYGDSGDWIEVYNAGSEVVNLGGKFLSDNLENPDKWQMPDYDLEPAGFVLFWADDDPDKGPFHTNFKLAAEGEELGIFDSESTGFYPLDTLAFGPQQTDISQGRFADGGHEWRYYPNPTPGISNLFDAVAEFEKPNMFQIFPNPNAGNTLYISSPQNLKIYNLSGQEIYSAQQVNEIDLSEFAPGFYLIQNNKGGSCKLVILGN